MTNCVVCQRIPPKEVFKATHQIFNTFGLSRKIIHNLAVEACHCIDYADKKNRIFFCGKPKASLLSGLFYLLALKHHILISQEEIANNIKCDKHGQYRIEHITAHTLRNMYRFWYKSFPELFGDIGIFFKSSIKPNGETEYNLV